MALTQVYNGKRSKYSGKTQKEMFTLDREGAKESLKFHSECGESIRETLTSALKQQIRCFENKTHQRMQLIKVKLFEQRDDTGNAGEGVACSEISA